MSSWLASFPFSLAAPWSSSTAPKTSGNPGQSGSASATPSPPLRRSRFPSPPQRGTSAVQKHCVEGSPSGSKRARDCAEAPNSERLSQDEDENEDSVHKRQKRQRGLVGSVLSTALDAAVFSTALGYSAYQLWKHPPTGDDVEELVQRKQLMLADTPHSASPVLPDAPPPYSIEHPVASTSTNHESLARASPSQIPRRVRHVHEPRPRISPRRSTLAPSDTRFASPPTSSFDFSEPYVSRDPLADLALAKNPTPAFQDPLAAEDEEVREDFEDDEEMRAVSERLKSLIETGREALASRPREWSSSSGSTLASSSTPRTRLSTNSSIESTATMGSLRKPSPLSQSSPRFETNTSRSPQLASLRSADADHPTIASDSPKIRRRSIDAPSSATPSSLGAHSAARARHRYSTSFGGYNGSETVLDNATGAVDQFERVLSRAKGPRSSLGGGR